MGYKAHCRDIVKRDDRDRYLLSLFVPSSEQAHVWTVLAFNQEIAKVRNTVTEPMLAEIRLQWWHDVLSELEEGLVREHPVVQGLNKLLQEKPYAHALLQGTLEARLMDVLGHGPADLESLINYAHKVGGSVQKLFAAALFTGKPSIEAYNTAEIIGEAWALIGLVRALPFQWQSGSGVLNESMPDGMALPDTNEAWEKLQPMLLRMIEKANVAIHQAKIEGSRLQRQEKGVLLPVVLLKQYLRQLEEASNNPFKLNPHATPDTKRLIALFWANLTGRY